MGCCCSNPVNPLPDPIPITKQIDTIIDKPPQKNNDEINDQKDKTNKKNQINNSKTSLRSKSQKSLPISKPDPNIKVMEPDDQSDVEEIPLKICYHNPENWKQLLSSLTGNQKLKEIALAKTRLDFKNMRAVKKHFKDLPIKDEIEKAWMIYLWVTNNFEYDGIGLKNDTKGDQDPESILKLGKCVCEGYGTIFRDLCDAVGLKSEAISGQTKDLKYKYGDNFGVGHKWSAIKIDDYWYPCDPTWGAGNLDDNYNFVKNFNPFYFFTPPQFILTDHFGETFKINEGKMTLQEFKYEPTFKLKFHVLNLKLLSNVKGIVESVYNPIVLEFFTPNDVILSGTLEDGNKTKIENCVIVQKDFKTSKSALITILPENNKNFFLNILAGTIDSNSSEAIAVFQLKCEDTKIINKIPKYYLSFEKELECVSHYNQLIFADHSPFTIEFSAPKKTLILPNLYKFNGDKNLNDCVLVQRNSINNNYAVILLFPDKFETYSLKMFAKYDTEEGNSYTFVGEFRFICKITKNDQSIPIYPIEFEKGLKTLQPTSLIQNITTSPYVLEFSAPKKTSISPSLYKFKDDKNLNDCVLVQRNSINNNYAVILLFPDKFETYSLKMFAKYDTEKGTSYTFVGEFKLLCKITGENKNIPKYPIEFEKGLKILEPSSLLQFVDASPHVLELSAPKSIDIIANIFSIDDIKIPECCVIQRDSTNSNYAIITSIPKPKSNYKLKIFAKDNSESANSYPFAGELRLICDIQKENKTMPKMKITFEFGLECLSHFSQIIYADKNPVEMEFNAPENVKFLMDLRDHGNIEIEGKTFLQKFPVTNTLKLQISLPNEHNKYILKIFGQNNPNISNFNYVGEFTIIKNSNFIYRNIEFPKIYSVNFDNFIYEPICSTLKISDRYTFKVYAVNVKKVAVVIGSDWYYLDQDDEDNVWIRDITIKNADNASIVGCLDKNNNRTIVEYKLAENFD